LVWIPVGRETKVFEKSDTLWMDVWDEFNGLGNFGGAHVTEESGKDNRLGDLH